MFCLLLALAACTTDLGADLDSEQAAGQPVICVAS